MKELEFFIKSTLRDGCICASTLFWSSVRVCNFPSAPFDPFILDLRSIVEMSEKSRFLLEGVCSDQPDLEKMFRMTLRSTLHKTVHSFR